MSGEGQLRERLRRQIPRNGRSGVDRATVQAIDEIIDSHVIDMRAEILRQQTAAEAELGELEARLHGLVAKYREEEEHQQTAVDDLRYQRRAARRRVEDRDTPMPAGPGGVEEPGYQHGNVGELAGRGVWTWIILWIVLCLAMAADVMTFRQVIERVVNDNLVFPLVAALTVTTTYLAHLAGELFRKAKQADRLIRRALGGWTLAAAWAAVGLGAFVVRLLAPPPVSGNAVENFVSSGTPAASTADGSPALSALMLLLLYVLTGAVAISAGYQRPREEIWQHRRTNRALRRVEPRLAAIRRDAAEAEALRMQLTNLQLARRELYAVEMERSEAAAARLKAEASMVIRQRSGGLRWFRRMIGNGAAPAHAGPIIDVLAPDEATRPGSADGGREASDESPVAGSGPHEADDESHVADGESSGIARKPDATAGSAG